MSIREKDLATSLARRDEELKQLKTRKLVLDKGVMTDRVATSVFSPAKPPTMPLSNTAVMAASKKLSSFRQSFNVTSVNDDLQVE